MTFVWMVECKTCQQAFAIKRRELVTGKSTESIPHGRDAGKHECPHCHEEHRYTTDDYIPGEGRLPS